MIDIIKKDLFGIWEFEVYYQSGVTRNNSIFLYGPTRSGKTTTLKTIDDYLSAQKGIKVLRLDAEDLISELVKGIRSTGDTKGFYHKFHYYDALLVDNVWVLRGKPRTTEEIFLLFGTFIDMGKLLIITWDIPPVTLSNGTKAVTKLNDRSVIIEMKPCNLFSRSDPAIIKLASKRTVGG